MGNSVNKKKGLHPDSFSYVVQLSWTMWENEGTVTDVARQQQIIVNF